MVNHIIVIQAITSGIVSFVTVYFSTPKIAEFMRKKGVVGVDVHKESKNKVPEMCGLSIFLGLATSLATLTIFSANVLKFLSFLLTLILAAILGIVDWFKPWSALQKVLLVALASIPFILLGEYQPYPVLPFIGKIRLTVIYPLIVIPALVTILGNTLNMIDVFNGSMAGVSAVSAGFLALISIILGKFDVLPLYLSLSLTSYAFYIYNKYPAKVFAGDIGSLTLGVTFALTSIIGGLEVLTLIVFIPSLTNSLLIVSSLGGFKERREIKDRPTILLKGELLSSSLSLKAPVTLTRIIVAETPLKEVEVVKVIIILHVFSGFLAILTATFMVG
ncbi:MAG: hypothetical protein N3E48_03275 [Candidatus Bathyarchaeota archaeon]|nr:hypothetical protein [Candidatus Bathyarchaeota archaeon]